jgi:hypothetical protein
MLKIDHARDFARLRRACHAREECESRVFGKSACSTFFRAAHGDNRRKRGFAHESRNRFRSGRAFKARGDSIAAPLDESRTEYARTRSTLDGQWDFF